MHERVCVKAGSSNEGTVVFSVLPTGASVGGMRVIWDGQAVLASHDEPLPSVPRAILRASFRKSILIHSSMKRPSHVGIAAEQVGQLSRQRKKSGNHKADAIWVWQ